MPETDIKWTGYNSQLWHIPERVPHPALEKLLIDKNHLIVLRHGQAPYRVVLGAPHQTAVGVRLICEHRLDANGNVKNRKADDNVASVALTTFSRLRDHNVPCKLVIMAHSTTHDPNKVLDSPYCQEVFSEDTELLLEYHACSAKRHLDLELSAGKNSLTPTVRYGRILGVALEYRYKLGVQIIAGKSNALILQPGGTAIEGKLQLPATKTISLTEAGRRGIPALHLEAKPIFRIPKDLTNTVSEHGLILGRAITQAIMLGDGSG